MNNYMNQNQYLPTHQYMQPMYPQSGTSVSPSTASMPPLPTGYPSGSAFASIPSQVQQTPVSDSMGLSSETIDSVAYTQGYLKRHIGERVKVEFLIGTNMLIDREGTLVDVGASYIVIRETETDDLLLADMYSIKFVRFYY
jgi:hypothetical protein